jgi:hypothetical protein
MTQELLTAERPATSTQHLVELRDVVMGFGDKQVLDHVSLAVGSTGAPGNHWPKRRWEDHDPAFDSRNPETECGLNLLQAT